MKLMVGDIVHVTDSGTRRCVVGVLTGDGTLMLFPAHGASASPVRIVHLNVGYALREGRLHPPSECPRRANVIVDDDLAPGEVMELWGR